MRLFARSGRLVFAALTVLAAGCGETPVGGEIESPPEPDPEALCAAWAVESCADLATCCPGEASFSGFECYRRLSAACLAPLEAEEVHSGARVFDEAAALGCLSQVDACRLQTLRTPAQDEACRNAVTGRRPPGTGCTSSSDCERPPRGHAICYEGLAPSGGGVCAIVAVSAHGKCSFVESTAVLTVCPTNSRCDVHSLPPAAAVPGADVFAFEADCEPLPVEGEECASVLAQEGAPRACAEGLRCAPDPADPGRSVCSPPAPIGEGCAGDGPDECGDGAACDPASRTCQTEPDPFCVEPAVCGNGACEPAEDGLACPEDCSSCGNGACEPQEEDWCPADCGEPACVGCARHVTLGGVLCEGTSTDLYAAFFDCTCGAPCASVCGADFCVGDDISTGCLECAASADGCAAQLDACAYDL